MKKTGVVLTNHSCFIAERLEKLWTFRQPSELYDDRDRTGQPGLDQFKPGSLFHVLLLGSPFQEDPSERKLPVPRWATANRRGLICQVWVTFCSISLSSEEGAEICVLQIVYSAHWI